MKNIEEKLFLHNRYTLNTYSGSLFNRRRYYYGIDGHVCDGICESVVRTINY